MIDLYTGIQSHTCTRSCARKRTRRGAKTRERGAISPTFPGALNLWKQVYFRCISASQDVSAAFEVHIPVSVPHLRLAFCTLNHAFLPIEVAKSFIFGPCCHSGRLRL